MQLCKTLLGRHETRDLPLDIILNIISRLPLNFIIQCKSLSKPLNNHISHPSFSRIRSNDFNYFDTIFVYVTKPQYTFSLDLVEFVFQSDAAAADDTYDNIHKFAVFNSDNNECHYFSIFGWCNSLFCFLKVESGLLNLYLFNPIFPAESFKLPDPAIHIPYFASFIAYGLGFCPFANKYKVLRIIPSCMNSGECKNKTEIFTIGSDRNWRSVLDVNVPYNLRQVQLNPNPQTYMVVFRYTLHWIVHPVRIRAIDNRIIKVKPNWGTGIYICAFDMTEETVTALPFPRQLFAYGGPPLTGYLRVLLDKLCLCRVQDVPGFYHDIELWVMNEYGVEESWTKQYIFNILSLPKDLHKHEFLPLTISPEGLAVISDGYNFIVYDLKENKCLKIIPVTQRCSYPVTFLPSFVSIRNLFKLHQ